MMLPSAPKSLIQDIDGLRSKLCSAIKSNPANALILRNCLDKNLMDECFNNSVAIEYNSYTKKKKTRKFKNDVKRLKKAWSYIKSMSMNEFNSNFESNIIAVNGILTDETIHTGYREIDIEMNPKVFGQNQIARPSWERVPLEMQGLARMIRQYQPKLIQSIKKKSYTFNWNGMHPVNYTAMSHQHLLWIHPFEDGNGRSTRLITNQYLISTNYHCINIEPEERDIYFNLLDMGHESIIEADPKKGNPFYAFVANKVYNGMKDCLDRII